MFPFAAAPIGRVAGAAFTTWNPADKDASVTLSNNNKTAASPGSAQLVRAVKDIPSKVYIEFLAVARNGASTCYGLATGSESMSTTLGVGGSSIGYQANGAILSGSADQGAGAYSSFFTNDRIGMAFDLNTRKLWFSLNGVFPSGNPSTGSGGIVFGAAGLIYPCVSPNGTVTANFGDAPFTYPVPTGFTGLAA